MKHWMTLVLVLVMAAPAMAFIGLPYADDATVEAGAMGVTAGVSFEDNVTLIGGRFSYDITDDVSLFGGGGMWKPDEGDSEIYIQVGGKYALPLDLPFDLAVRAAFGTVFIDDVDLFSVNGGALGSMPLDDMFSIYAFLGLSYARVSAGEFSDSNTELAIAGGGLFNLDENISFFAELAHIDELFISLGARYNF